MAVLVASIGWTEYCVVAKMVVIVDRCVVLVVLGIDVLVVLEMIVLVPLEMDPVLVLVSPVLPGLWALDPYVVLGLVAGVEISPGVNVDVTARATGTSKEKTKLKNSLIVQAQVRGFSLYKGSPSAFIDRARINISSTHLISF